jgi:DNA polymerase IV
MRSMARIIIHLDMDAFFAAVEQRDTPGLRGVPVVIGADPRGGKGRGVVSTCSYEARGFGIHSAMPISEAFRRCPHAAFLPVDGARYGRESERIRALLDDFTPTVQFVSIDEGYMDMTGCLHMYADMRAMAEAIRDRVEQETGLTASLGVAPCKLVAKIASDLEKPRGIVVVEPDDVRTFLAPLAVGRIPGVGPKARQSLEKLGVRTIGELACIPRGVLREHLGQAGGDLYRKARGIDESPVCVEGDIKSIGHEHTFEVDTADAQLIDRTVMRLCEKVARRLRKSGKRGHVVATKVRFEDFTTLSRRRTLAEPVLEAASLHEVAMANLANADATGRKLRLIGVQVTGFSRPHEGLFRQTSLFAPPTENDIAHRLARAEDAVMDKFGDSALHRGASLVEDERRDDTLT